jgi:ABC-type branched-subunit amino acid transport system substrate-binding protein
VGEPPGFPRVYVLAAVGMRGRYGVLAAASLLAVAILSAGCSAQLPRTPAVVGAIYPLSGPQSQGGAQELAGVRAALTLARNDVQLRVISVETSAEAQAAVDRLVDHDHVPVILGTYGSTLADAAAARAEQRHVVYWETGAVADIITQRRSYVFRTVATGMTLGQTAVDFTSQVLVAAAGVQNPAVRAVIVNVDDVYGRSVADGEQALAAQLGIPVVDRIQYDPRAFDPYAIADRLASDRADYLWDVSYIDDGVKIWQAVSERAVPLRAAVGTSSAFCMDEFSRRLGARSVGVYAADKPDSNVNSSALAPPARDLLRRAQAAYGGNLSIPATAGFVGGWALFHDVFPKLAGRVTPDGVRTAAYELDQPANSTINGGGIKFAGPTSPDPGQNLRAPSVVGQWQAVGKMRVVYPDAFASARPIIPPR